MCPTPCRFSAPMLLNNATRAMSPARAASTNGAAVAGEVAIGSGAVCGVGSTRKTVRAPDTAARTNPASVRSPRRTWTRARVSSSRRAGSRTRTRGRTPAWSSS